MSNTLKLDLRGKSCDEYILELSRVLLSMNVKDIVTVIADKDRVSCTHQLLKNSPRYLLKIDIFENYVEISIKRLR